MTLNASDFLSFLSSPEAGEIFKAQGFTILP
jgi:ABC-type molybdate transport system substrate-binding protein